MMKVQKDLSQFVMLKRAAENIILIKIIQALFPRLLSTFLIFVQGCLTGIFGIPLRVIVVVMN